jgi:hypothetical protein
LGIYAIPSAKQEFEATVEVATNWVYLLFGTLKNAMCTNCCRRSLPVFKELAGASERTCRFCSPLIVSVNGCWTAIVKLSDQAGVVHRNSLCCCIVVSSFAHSDGDQICVGLTVASAV